MLLIYCCGAAAFSDSEAMRAATDNRVLNTNGSAMKLWEARYGLVFGLALGRRSPPVMLAHMLGVSASPEQECVPLLSLLSPTLLLTGSCET
jgi:hypothetical protein